MLQYETHFFQSVFNHVSLGIANVSINGVTQQVNPACCHFLGYHESELSDKLWSDFISPADLLNHDDLLDKLLSGLFSEASLGQRYLHKDGHIIWANLHVTLVRNDLGAPSYFLLEISDNSKNIQQYESEWRDVFEYASWGVVISDSDGTLLEHMNPAFAHIYGYTVEELTGRPILEMFAQESRAKFAEHIEIAQRLGHHSFDSVHLRKDGITFPVLIDISIVWKDDGGIKYRVINVQDITLNKAAEKRLQHFAAIVESSVDAIIGKSLDGIVASWNRGAEKLFGYSADEMLGQSINVVIPENWHREEHEKLRRIAANEIISNYETKRCRKDGQLIDVSITTSPIRDGAGKVLGASSVVQDISERKRAEQSLKQSLEFTECVINAIPDLLLELDRYGRYLNVWAHNPSLLIMKKDELLGKTVWDVFSQDSAELIMSAIEEAAEKGYSFGKTLCVNLSHEERWIELSVSKKACSNSSVNNFIVLSRDITERKRSADLFIKSERKLEDAQRVAHLGSWELDLILNELSWSDEIYRIFELDSKQFKPSYEAFISIIHPEDRQAVNQAYVDSLVNQTNYEIQHRLLMPDGRIKWVHESCETMYDTNGEPMRSLGTVQDISERKQMEEGLLYQEYKYRSLAENSPNIIMRYDIHCNLVYVNPAFAKETGVSSDIVENVLANEQWGAGMSMSVEEFKSKIMQVIETGEASEIVIDWYRLDSGKVSSHIFNLVAEYQPDGQLLGVLLIGHNITTLKAAEKRLEYSNVRLRGLSEALVSIREEERKRIARDMHDELGQYLTGLRMGISVLRMQFADRFPEILQQVHDLSILTDKTMRVVRNIAASLRPSSLDMGVNFALEWLAAEFFERTGIDCKLITDDDDINIDDKHATALFRIVQESLTNITRHAEASQVEIRLRCLQQDQSLEIDDNATGLDMTSISNKAIGLQGIQERVIILGGDFAINSVPGQGTNIVITIPNFMAENEQ